jgi:hypothetical protein
MAGRAAIPNIVIGKNISLLTKPKKICRGEQNPQALTDGALGGNFFYSNYLGFEGNKFGRWY